MGVGGGAGEVAGDLGLGDVDGGVKAKPAQLLKVTREGGRFGVGGRRLLGDGVPQRGVGRIMGGL